jgi:NAD(P)-dependent dehydrogenase (short-subunit alcohol dehydrogenase family)
MAKTESLIERLFSLEGKAALVTGGSSGIGQAIAVAFAGAGADVAVNGTRPDKLEATSRLIEAEGRRAVLLPADVGHVEACRKLVSDAHSALGRLDILVNCAGMNRRKPITEATEDDFDRILAVNLRSAYFASQAAQPLMAAQGGGKIINIGSMTCYIGLGAVSVYGMSKSALGEVTKTMAIEWAPSNIQVNCLAPGFIRTPLTEEGVWKDPKKANWILNRVAARRAGHPEDLIGTAILLASTASDYITGQIIGVDGGFLAGGSWDLDPA